MKKIIFFAIVFSSASLISLQTARAFFIEPSVFHTSGDSKLSSNLGAYEGIEGSVSGTGLGLRAGMSFIVPFFGVDLMFSQPRYDFDSNLLPEGPSNSVWAGLVAGAKLPLTGLRAWASYLPYGTTTVGDHLLLTKGSAVKLGLGWKIVPLISFNAEYMMQEFKSVEDSTPGGIGEIPETGFENNSLIFSLSIVL